MRGRPPRIFLTGASSGIGAALARRYAASGATLGLLARRGELLESLAAELGCPCHCYSVDVADAAALRAAAEDFMVRAGVPDVVIANAGVSSGTLTERGEDLPPFRRIFEINVFGMLHTFSPFIAAMRGQGGGTLAGIASVAGVRGIPGAGAYSASKAAAISYLESLRVELRGSGIRVVTVAPGYIATPMTAVNRYPMPFILPADEAARRIARDIGKGVSFSVVPWQMAVVAKLLRWLPDPLFDRAFARAGRKPRHLLE
jgi:NAD(P)-dependent dehydrogenase (short-subunit alcohol dehydrogenase family)